MNALLLSVLLLLDSNYGKLPAQSVDTIEINACFDEKNELCFRQILLWRWSHDYGREDIGSWVLLKDAECIYISPAKGGHYITLRANSQEWTFFAPYLRKSMTMSSNDPERQNKKLLDEKYRLLFTPHRGPYRE